MMVIAPEDFQGFFNLFMKSILLIIYLIYLKNISKGGEKMKGITANHRSKVFNTNTMVKISVLAVLSFILMLFEVLIPIFPGFLKMDLSDVPALLGSFALGPAAGVMIELLKNILHIAIRGSITGGVGELSNFLVGAIFVFTAGSIYQMKKSKKNAIFAMIVATIAMSMAGILTNYYLIIPFYSKIMPLDAIIEMGTKANSAIVDLKTLIIYGVTPFNLLKGAIISIVVSITYKKVSPILHKA